MFIYTQKGSTHTLIHHERDQKQPFIRMLDLQKLKKINEMQVKQKKQKNNSMETIYGNKKPLISDKLTQDSVVSFTPCTL